MNETEGLRERIGHLDPASRTLTSPVDSPRGRALLEEIMKAPIDSRDRMDAIEETRSATPIFNSCRRPPRGRRLLSAAAAVIAVVAVALALTRGTNDATREVAHDSQMLHLSLGEGPDPMTSCPGVDSESVATLELAFVGTVTSVDDEHVSLDVDRWYTGGNAIQVRLTSPSNTELLIGRPDFLVGAQYVVSAISGVVTNCGFSGPAADLQPTFDTAFPD